MTTIARFTAEGFVSEVTLAIEEGREVVRFRADGDIDADGANGQHGGLAAYMAANKGSDHLANGGMGWDGHRVVGVTSWWTDIVLVGPDGNPLILSNGVVHSMTAYKFPGKEKDDPERYVDSETVAYCVVPPIILRATDGAVLGCRCSVRNRRNDLTSEGIVGDVGPRSKVGEISIQMARELHIPHSPRTGGVDEAILDYTIYPGEPGVVAERLTVLQRMDGSYVA